VIRWSDTGKPTHPHSDAQDGVGQMINALPARSDASRRHRRRAIEDPNLAGLQARQEFLEHALQVLRFVAVNILGVNPRGDARTTRRRGDNI